jgi:glycosyltransferase involved in cell wall biosynthesis
MGDIQISIITPTYNHEKFIGKCIESVLAQNYPHWEQIIVDDGSTDGTEEIVNSYNDKRIKFIKNEHKGILRLKETYDMALDKSMGKIIAILEGDDYWPDYKLEKQISSFDDPDVVLSWGKACITNEHDKITGYRPKSINWLKKKSDKKLYKNLFFGNFIPACTVMCRRSTLIEINGFKQCKKFPYVDHTTWLELGLRGKLIYLDHVLGYWRHHDTQISVIMSLEMVESLIYGINLLKRMSKDQRKHLNIGLTDLISFNFSHFLYNLIYSFEDNNPHEKSYNSDRTSNIKFYSRFRLLFQEVYEISKINLRWLIFIILKRY